MSMNRSTLASVLRSTGVLPLVLALRKRGLFRPWIPVLTYHRVARPEDAGTFDPGVVDVTPEAFDEQVGFLVRWFDLVGLDELVAFRRGKRLPPNPLLITFDDGYLDNHDTALPILRAHGARAAFFIATSYIEERRLFWWDRVNHLVKSSRAPAIELTYPRPMRLLLATERDRKRAVTALLRVIKDHFGLDLPRFLDEVSRAARVALDAAEERRLVDRTLMTWDHVRALRRAGMDIGSHTCTHRVLQTLPPDALARELAGSRSDLEKVLGEPVRTISYPVGKALAYTPAIRNAVHAAGYELGFSNGTGVNHVWRFDALDARRISMDVGLSPTFYRAMVTLPYLAY
jgi:peptidoglycan/xylan/chitin deacetylase (PgdA/CDA1 family)